MSAATASPQLEIVSARPEHVPLVVGFIRKLAEYEKLAHEVTADEASIYSALFGERRAAEVVLAFVDGRAAGFALFFTSFSTFAGRPGIYLEDLFVEQDMRGKGVGKALLKHLAKLAVARGCARFEWSVLDWNTPSIDFYKRLGARAMDEWTIYRLTGAELARLAE